MTSFENLTADQKIRASLHRDISALAKETCHFIGLDITKPAMDMILEVFVSKIWMFAEELEAMARHGKGYIIHRDDIKVVSRNNPSLLEYLDAIDTPVAGTSTTREACKRRRTAGMDTPAKRARALDGSRTSTKSKYSGQ